MLEFTLDAHTAKRIGTVYDALDAKAVKGLPFDGLFVSFDGEERITVLASDRYLMLDVSYAIEATGDDVPVTFALSPAQAKALKSAKAPIRIKTIKTGHLNAETLVHVWAGEALIASEHDTEKTEKFAREFERILNEKFTLQASGSVVAIDLTRIAGLAKLPSDWRMTFIGKNEPVRFTAPNYRALIQAKREA